MSDLPIGKRERLVSIHVRVPEAVRKEAGELAASKNVTPSEICRSILVLYFNGRLQFVDIPADNLYREAAQS